MASGTPTGQHSTDNGVPLDGYDGNDPGPSDPVDDSSGTSDPVSPEVPVEPDPTTFLHISNYWGLPQEIYVDEEFIVLAESGETSDDFPVEPGFQILCAYLIGKIDGVCDPPGCIRALPRTTVYNASGGCECACSTLVQLALLRLRGAAPK